MLHQNVKAQGFRVLNEDEIGAVCGGFGDITVTAPRRNSFSGGGFNGTIENDFSYVFALAQGAADSVLDNLYNLPGFDWAAFEATNATPAQPPQQPPGAGPWTPAKSAAVDKQSTSTILNTVGCIGAIGVTVGTEGTALLFGGLSILGVCGAALNDWVTLYNMSNRQ